MSKTTNEHWSFRLILQYHSTTEDVFFHWFILIFSNMLVLTLSSICLLILHVSVLDGLISEHEILSWNLSCLSLIDMYALLSSNICIRSSSFNLLAICFALIVVTFFISFCYVVMHKLFFVEHFDSDLFTFYTIYTYAPLLK